MTSTPKAQPIPDRYRRVTPSLIVDGAGKALEFYADFVVQLRTHDELVDPDAPPIMLDDVLDGLPLGAGTKVEAVRKIAQLGRSDRDSVTVKIHNQNGRIQQERTYPRSADPRSRKS